MVGRLNSIGEKYRLEKPMAAMKMLRMAPRFFPVGCGNTIFAIFSNIGSFDMPVRTKAPNHSASR